MSDNNFYNSSLSVDKDVPFTSIISSNYFYRDKKNIDEEINRSEFDTYGKPQIIQDNHFDLVRVYNYSDENGWAFLIIFLS